jgi:hypothetical protein
MESRIDPRMPGGCRVLGSSAKSRRPAEGPPRAGVTIEDLDIGARGVGLSQEDLQLSVGRQLRRTGLRVSHDSASAASRPFLYVQITTFALGDAHFYIVSTELHEAVRVLRNGRLAIAGTWTKRSGGVATTAALHDAILQSVRERTNDFIDSWLAANPR